MATADPMTCPHCGVAMNLHAEKVDYAAALDGDEAADADLGGVLEEVHACPQCGRSATRRPAPRDDAGA